MAYVIYKRSCRVRRAVLGGKEITIPSEVLLRAGDTFIAFWDGFVLFIPNGTCVDEVLLREAIRRE